MANARSRAATVSGSRTTYGFACNLHENDTVQRLSGMRFYNKANHMDRHLPEHKPLRVLSNGPNFNDRFNRGKCLLVV